MFVTGIFFLILTMFSKVSHSKDRLGRSVQSTRPFHAGNGLNVSNITKQWTVYSRVPLRQYFMQNIGFEFSEQWVIVCVCVCSSVCLSAVHADSWNSLRLDVRAHFIECYMNLWRKQVNQYLGRISSKREFFFFYK